MNSQLEAAQRPPLGPPVGAMIAAPESGSATSETDAASQYITFTIGSEEYGVDVMAVREIKAWTETTSLPNSPDYVRGVVNLRGHIIPIFDLRRRFGQGLTEP